MRIRIAGAGAGKTTKMAELLAQSVIPEGMIIYCVAFTHAAVDNINTKIKERLGDIPDYIRISTIHSFLNQELIEPYYYLLYGKHFQKISIIDLPTEKAFEKIKLFELNNENILHQTQIPEYAQWVVDKKSKDTIAIKETRKRVLLHLKKYCYRIIVDEAQDIDKFMARVLSSLDRNGIDIELHGDPKQDVKGNGCFKQLIESANEITYSKECHRCPEKHLTLSNRLAEPEEKQNADPKNKSGKLEVIYESDVRNIEQLKKIVDGYGLKYISKKHGVFLTGYNGINQFESMFYEIGKAMEKKHSTTRTEVEIKRGAFYITEKVFSSTDPKKELGDWINKYKAFDYPGNAVYKRLMDLMADKNAIEGIEVKSIEKAKGLEDENCLFILTTDLVPYLTGERKDDNKTKHLLYVALTRSLDNLTILVTKDAEEKYGREIITQSVLGE